MPVNPPPSLDDEFDHEEKTNVERDHANPSEINTALDHDALVSQAKRLVALEERIASLETQLAHVGDLIRQLVERLERLEYPAP
jgi:polyhydroxyalkanoate synthesis regulator phasin